MLVLTFFFKIEMPFFYIPPLKMRQVGYVETSGTRHPVTCRNVPVQRRPNQSVINPLKPNDTYKGRTAPLTSKRCILYIYSTDIGTEYFKHGIYSPFFPLQNAVCFIILTYLVPVLFTFYIQVCQNLKKNNSGAKRLKRYNSAFLSAFG